MQETDSITAYCQQLPRCAALLFLLRPRDGVADNNHTNWKEKNEKEWQQDLFSINGFHNT